MVNGDVDGEALSDADLGKFFVLLVVAALASYLPARRATRSTRTP